MNSFPSGFNPVIEVKACSHLFPHDKKQLLFNLIQGRFGIIYGWDLYLIFLVVMLLEETLTVLQVKCVAIPG